MAIPSQARKHFREGVETRRAAPKPRVGNGEGIVQTTNPPLAGRRKPKWYENPQAARPCGFNSLRPHHTRFLSGPGWNHPDMFIAVPDQGCYGPRSVRRCKALLHTNVCSAPLIIPCRHHPEPRAAGIVVRSLTRRWRLKRYRERKLGKREHL